MPPSLLDHTRTRDAVQERRHTQATGDSSEDEDDETSLCLVVYAACLCVLCVLCVLYILSVSDLHLLLYRYRPKKLRSNEDDKITHKRSESACCHNV